MARKKILSLWLALTLICGLTTPAFAAGKTVQIPTNGHNSNLDGVSVTLSNVLAVKTVPVTFCYPGEWISDTEFSLEFEERPITVYCISRSGSVLTVKDKEDRKDNVWKMGGCVLDEDGYEGDRHMEEEDELQPYSAGPHTTAFDLDMGPTYVETDIHGICIEGMDLYYTYCDLSEYPDGEMIEAVPETEQNEQNKQNKQDEGQVTADGVRILFRDQEWTTDVGAWYAIEFTNTTDQPLQGNYALLTYYPFGGGQIMFFDLSLAPGECAIIKQNSWQYASPEMKMIWVRFDSAEEKDQFENSVPCSESLRQTYHTYNYYPIGGDSDSAFYRDTFGLNDI